MDWKRRSQIWQSVQKLVDSGCCCYTALKNSVVPGGSTSINLAIFLLNDREFLSRISHVPNATTKSSSLLRLSTIRCTDDNRNAIPSDCRLSYPCRLIPWNTSACGESLVPLTLHLHNYGRHHSMITPGSSASPIHKEPNRQRQRLE